MPRNAPPPQAQTGPATSARRDALLERAYAYVLTHGLTELSLRPLAAAIGTSPRVLLFLFGSKDDLVQAILARARAQEVEIVDRVREETRGDLIAVAMAVWRWLSAPEHRSLLTLWSESYARSLIAPDGPWSGFARDTVDDWLALLARAQSPRRRKSRGGEVERTLVLAVLRGALLDLLATGDKRRTTAAVHNALDDLRKRRA
jgi:AcrR family transcriptional regulator